MNAAQLNVEVVMSVGIIWFISFSSCCSLCFLVSRFLISVLMRWAMRMRPL